MLREIVKLKNESMRALLYLTVFTFCNFALVIDVHAEYVPGELLVKYRSNAAEIALNSLHANIASTKKGEYKRVRIHHVKLPDNMGVKEAVEYYSQDPNVEYAEPNYIFRATSIPNDPSFSNLWGLNNSGQSGGTIDADIDAPEAWDITTGSTSVIVAVIDSGIAYNHPDLIDNIWTNSSEIGALCTNSIDDNANGIIDECDECGDGTDNDGNGYIDDCRGWDFINSDNDPMDHANHGTHVAGTIAAAGNNNVGVAGVMWNAKIMNLRFLDIDGAGANSDAIAALEYAADKGAHIINASWGGPNFSQLLKDAIDAVNNAVVVCAAGNGGSSTPFYPASFDSGHIISVAATDHNDAIASFSNFGPANVDLTAPGVTIYSTIPERETILYDNFNDNDFADWSTGGTNESWALDLIGKDNYALIDSLADYISSTDSWIQSSVMDLSGKTSCRLIYWMSHALASGDSLDIQASKDPNEPRTWTTLRSVTGTATAEYSDELTDYDGEATSYIRFNMVTDASNNDDGVYIDNVQVTCSSSVTHGNLSGTSMAAPHVSGVAGLIKALNAGITEDEIKSAILTSVDASCSLENIVSAKGRLNAFNALLVSQGDNSGLSGTLSCNIPAASSGGGGGGGGCFIKSSIHKNSASSYIHEIRRLFGNNNEYK